MHAYFLTSLNYKAIEENCLYHWTDPVRCVADGALLAQGRGVVDRGLIGGQGSWI